MDPLLYQCRTHGGGGGARVDVDGSGPRAGIAADFLIPFSQVANVVAEVEHDRRSVRSNVVFGGLSIPGSGDRRILVALEMDLLIPTARHPHADAGIRRGGRAGGPRSPGVRAVGVYGRRAKADSSHGWVGPAKNGVLLGVVDNHYARTLKRAAVQTETSALVYPVKARRHGDSATRDRDVLVNARLEKAAKREDYASPVRESRCRWFGNATKGSGTGVV